MAEWSFRRAGPHHRTRCWIGPQLETSFPKRHWRSELWPKETIERIGTDVRTLCPAVHTTDSLAHLSCQDLLNLIRLLDLYADSDTVYTWLDENLFICVSGYSEGNEEDFGVLAA